MRILPPVIIKATLFNRSSNTPAAENNAPRIIVLLLPNASANTPVTNVKGALIRPKTPITIPMSKGVNPIILKYNGKIGISIDELK